MYSTPPLSSLNSIVTLIGDSGASDTVLRSSDAHIAELSASSLPFTVALPDGELIHSLASGTLACAPDLKIAAHIFSDQDLKESLLSLSAVCNQDCVVELTQTSLAASRNGQLLLSGHKDPDEKLWRIPFPTTSPQQRIPRSEKSDSVAFAGTVIHSESDADFVAFVHASIGSPPVSSFHTAAQKGWLRTYPRLTAAIISKNRPITKATAQGHLDQTRQRQRSTRTASPRHVTIADPVVSDSDTPSAPDPKILHVFLFNSEDLAQVDATGRFPFPSFQGSQYILVFIYLGYIHMEPLHSRTAAAYIAAYKSYFLFLRKTPRGLPTALRIDNETSDALETLFLDNNLRWQKVPPGTHRQNLAERMMRPVKNHIISTLATVDPSFPIQLWDTMLEQAEICINLLRPSLLDPNISAYEGLHGQPYDFLAHPIAPFGMSVLIHDKPDSRSSWAPHGVPGYYLGPALEHYRCWRTWASQTRKERISDTLAWFPAPFRMPGSSYHEVLSAAIKDLSSTLSSYQRHCESHGGVFDTLSAAQLTTQLRQLQTLFSSPLSASSSADIQRVLEPANVLPETAPVPDLILANPSIPLPHDPAPAASPTPQGPTQQFQHPTTRLTRGRARQQRLATPAAALAVQSNRVRPTIATNDTITNPSPSLLPPLREGIYAPPPSHLTSLIANARALPVTPPPSPLALDPAIAMLLLNLDSNGNPLQYKTAMAGQDRAQWEDAHSIEIRRLLNTGTNKPIHPHEQPADRRRDTTYYNPQVKVKLKEGHIHRRVRGTIGGNRIHALGNVSARTADLEVLKALLNSTMADDANWMTIDITDFYLNHPLERPEYYRMPVKHIPPTVMDEFKLHHYIHNDHILMQVDKTMYGLPQAGSISQEHLVHHLATHGYHQCPNVPCLFNHVDNGVQFCLTVDDFGIKYRGHTGPEHLIATLRLKYDITIDWTGKKYLGIDIAFAPDNSSVSLSMPGYIDKVLRRFQTSPLPSVPSPMLYVPPAYGKSSGQQVSPEILTPLSPDEITRCQEIIGSLLYYARAVDSTMLTAVNAIASELARPTQLLHAHIQRLLAYAASYPNNSLVYKRSNMLLSVHSDASYLSRSRSRSVAGGIGFLGNDNPPLFAISSILDVVVASAAESEYGSLFVNAQHAEWTRTILTALGHPQLATVITCDNKCAVGLANDTLKIKRSKSIDMRFHWIRDRIRQGHFVVVWAPGADNRADFFTKALPTHAHQAHMPSLVVTPPSPFRRAPHPAHVRH